MFIDHWEAFATVNRITADFCRCTSELYIHTGSSHGGTYVSFGGPYTTDIKFVAVTVLIPNAVQARWCFSLVRQHKSVAKSMYPLIPPCTYWSFGGSYFEQVSTTQTMLRRSMLHICHLFVTNGLRSLVIDNQDTMKPEMTKSVMVKLAQGSLRLIQGLCCICHGCLKYIHLYQEWSHGCLTPLLLDPTILTQIHRSLPNANTARNQSNASHTTIYSG